LGRYSYIAYWVNCAETATDFDLYQYPNRAASYNRGGKAVSREIYNMTSTVESAVPKQALSEAPTIRRVEFDAPWGWLGAGWRDLWSHSKISLAYGAAFSVASYALLLCLLQTDALPLILPLGGGFLLLGPLFAVGLYEISRRRELGESVSFADVLHAGSASRGQIALFGVMLLIVNFTWMLLAFLLFMLFFGPAGFPPIEEFIPTLLFTHHGLGLLVVGTAVGAALAAVTFAISAISVPMLLDRKVDAVTASILSVEAVRLNWRAMGLWAALILALCACGIVALFVGLAVVFPLIGHATWHAYRELTGTSASLS
jgi:uncharacterized membrane protein